MSSPTQSSVVADALTDFFTQLYDGFYEIFRRFFSNLYKSFAELSVSRWTKVILSVVGYILVRPYIEAWFRKMADRDRIKQQEKEKAKREAAAGEEKKKAKMSANALRGGGSGGTEGGKILGEVENTDDELGEADEFATASGVPEWGKNTRKRMKKHKKNLEKEGAAVDGENKLTEEQIMDLLDWSESEGEREKKA